jgi:hypothetical protein
MALNLQYTHTLLFRFFLFIFYYAHLRLVLVFGVNGNKMEKFYVFSAVLLAGACNIPTWAAGEAG